MSPADKGFFKETQTLFEEYVKERIILVKLQTAEKTAKLAAFTVTGFIICFFLAFILLFLSLMAVYFFQQLTGNWFYGLGIVAGFYMLLVLIMLIFRKSHIHKMIENAVVRVLFEKSADNDEEEPG